MKHRLPWLLHILGIQAFLLSLGFFFAFTNAYEDSPLAAGRIVGKGIFIYGIFLFFSILAIWWKSRVLADGFERMDDSLTAFAEGRTLPPLLLSPVEEVARLQVRMDTVLQEAQQAMARLHHEKNELDLVLSTMLEGVVLLDETDRITRMNRQAAEMFGVSPQKAAGRHLVEILRHAELATVLDEQKKKNTGVSQDIVMNAPDSRVFQLQCIPVHNAAGRQTGRLLVFEDVTALRRLESMRRDFSANVSHELKTPITSILGFIETLRDPDASISEEERRRYLDIAAHQAQRMNAIVEDLLHLSRIETIDHAGNTAWESVNIAEIVESAIGMCARSAESKGIRIHREFAVRPLIPADASLLEQAVINIMDNAIKYSGEGTTVCIRLEKTDDDVRIRVQDRGIGIPERDLPHIFERFYRVDKGRSRVAGGTGLGLSIAHHILRLHRGRIEVESTLGEGSTFTLVLPKPPVQLGADQR